MKNETSITKRMTYAALTAIAGCCFTFVTPALACSGPKKSGYLAPIAPSFATLARVGALGTRPKAPSGGARAGAPAQTDTTVFGPSIVGLWDTMYLVDNQVADRGYEVWHSDGTEILVDIAPPATDNVCIGVWVQTGVLSYSLTHPSWTFDMAGNLTGTAIIGNDITISHDGDKFTGTFTVDTYDVAGRFVSHFEGQLSAQRIKPL